LVYILYTLFFVSCVLLIASVLLQPGKTDAGALFTSNISSTAFQPRGAQTILSKITIGAATLFMLSALFLAMPALTGNVSVLQTTSSDTPTETAPPATDSNSNVDTNANIDADATTNVNTNVDASVPSNTAIVVNTNSPTKVNVGGNGNRTTQVVVDSDGKTSTTTVGNANTSSANANNK
jgi:preprotein translocase subunit SecG